MGERGNESESTAKTQVAGGSESRGVLERDTVRRGTGLGRARARGAAHEAGLCSGLRRVRRTTTNGNGEQRIERIEGD